MKTTIDIADNLLIKAKQVAAKETITLKTLTEEGLKLALDRRASCVKPKIKPVTMKGKGLHPEFESGSWENIRSTIYQGHGG